MTIGETIDSTHENFFYPIHDILQSVYAMRLVVPIYAIDRRCRMVLWCRLCQLVLDKRLEYRLTIFKVVGNNVYKIRGGHDLFNE